MQYVLFSYVNSGCTPIHFLQDFLREYKCACEMISNQQSDGPMDGAGFCVKTNGLDSFLSCTVSAS